MISEKLLPALVAVLVASVAANALLGVAWLSARDDATKAAAELVGITGQRDGSQACSDAIEALGSIAAQRVAEAAPARAAAAARSRHPTPAPTTRSRASPLPAAAAPRSRSWAPTG